MLLSRNKILISRTTILEPRILKSPYWVLQNQEATCFELSTLLVSLLIGNGYDAYVVSGYASKHCCQQDQTYTNCPQHFQCELDELSAENESHIPSAQKSLSERENIGMSKYLQMVESQKNAEAKRKCFLQQEQKMLEIKELEKIPPDELERKRVHSWVLIIVNTNKFKFIEPSTGDIFELSNNPYFDIESLWNHQNYWVKVKLAIPLPEMIFDLTNLKYWEHLLIAEPWSVYSKKLHFNDNLSTMTLKHFAMPSSWVARLKIPGKNYLEKYPKSRKINFYKKSKIEKFSRNLHLDGTVLRITGYDDYFYKNTIRTAIMFVGRVDYMQKMKIDLKTETVWEYFDFGRIDFLKKHEYCQSTPLRHDSKMEFYSGGRLDNLSSLCLSDSESNIIFNSRQDRLKSYSVKFQPSKMTDEIQDLKNYIMKITAKYDEYEPNGIEFHEFREDEIFTMFNYRTKEIIQERNLQIKNYGIESKLLKIEKKCRAEVAQLIQEIHNILEKRGSEKENLNLQEIPSRNATSTTISS